MLVTRLAMLATLWSAVPSAPVHGQTSASPGRATGPLADSLRAFAFEIVARLRDRNAAGTLALYGDTAHFVHVDDGQLIPWASMSAMVRRFFTEVTSNPVCVVGEPGVTITDPDNAVLYVTHRFSATAGRPAHAGIWTGVLHRYPEGWRIVHSHSSALPSGVVSDSSTRTRRR
jgi:hypothetical protein